MCVAATWPLRKSTTRNYFFVRTQSGDESLFKVSSIDVNVEIIALQSTQRMLICWRNKLTRIENITHKKTTEKKKQKRRKLANWYCIIYVNKTFEVL
jgi:hypothetical protein